MSDNKRVFSVSHQTLKDIVATIQQAKVQARSLEQAADSLEILADDPVMRTELQEIAHHANNASFILTKHYKMIAREAMSED